MMEKVWKKMKTACLADLKFWAELDTISFLRAEIIIFELWGGVYNKESGCGKMRGSWGTHGILLG